MNHLSSIRKVVLAARLCASDGLTRPSGRSLCGPLLLAWPKASARALTVSVGLSAVAASVALQQNRGALTMYSQRAFSGVQCSTVEQPTQRTGFLEVQFCGKGQTFTPIYEKNPAVPTASVNAGDHALYVGGGAINFGFAKMLGLDPSSNAYKDVHDAMAELAQLSPGRLQDLSAAGTVNTSANTKVLARDLGLVGLFARAPLSNLGSSSLTGTAFLDVFEAKTRPLSDKNVAMLYVVGPKGQGAVHAKGAGQIISDCGEFLVALQRMSENALLLVCEYNHIASREVELPVIKAVQFCLVSGGVYKHADASKADVAEAIVRGLCNAAPLAQPGTLPVIRFAYDDAAFEEGCWKAAGTGCLLNCSQ